MSTQQSTVFTKKVAMKIKIVCDIHSTEMVVYRKNTDKFDLHTGVCDVDDGCTPENYVIEILSYNVID